MTVPLSERLGLEPRELIAIVGAGGKTTIMGILARELGAAGARIIVTTTTKMGMDQVIEPVCWSDESDTVEAMLSPGVPLSVLLDTVGGKVRGLDPDAIDALYLSTSADFIIVEADGARSLSVKAPAGHEPVIPGLSTTVIVVMGADALMNTLESVGHRVDRLSALTGLSGDDVITPHVAAEILLHPNGGLKDIPEGARVEMAISKVTSENQVAAKALASILDQHPRVDGSVLVWSSSATH